MKKSILTKTISILISALLLLSVFAMTVAAAPADTETKRNLTIHKYLMDDVSDAVNRGDGTELTSGDLPEGAELLDGINFIVIPAYTLAEANAMVADNTNYPSITNISDFQAITGVAASDLGFYYLKADYAKSAYKYTTGDGSPDPLGLIELNDLEAIYGNLNGVYYVEEQVGDPRVVTPSAPFLVSVPMANPTYGQAVIPNPNFGQEEEPEFLIDDEEWLYDVHVYPKNGRLQFKKTIDDLTTTEKSFFAGNEITWNISMTIPSEVETATVFKITDILHADFVLDPLFDAEDDVMVYIVGSPDIILDVNVDYTVTWTPGTRTLEVDLIDGIEVLEGYIGETLVISFKTTLADTVENGTRVNKATLNYSTPHVNMANKDTHDATVYFGAIVIDKFDRVDGAKLADAEFKLATSYNGSTKVASGFLRKDPVSGEILAPGDNGYASLTSDDDWLITTDAAGYAIFNGLKYDFTTDPTYGSTTYYLVEETAPATYNKLDEVQIAVLTQEKDLSMVIQDRIVMAIANSRGFQLPLTGGAGVVLFTIIGLAIMGGSILMLALSKKKKEAVK